MRHKLENVHESTELVSLLYSDTGTGNQVIEVWHHGEGLQAMDESRAKGRQYRSGLQQSLRQRV